MNSTLNGSKYIEKLHILADKLDHDNYKAFWQETEISGEKLAAYKELIEKIFVSIDNNRDSNDGSRMTVYEKLDSADPYLTDMCAYFDEALKRGNEKTADRMIASIIESINCMGRTVMSDAADEEIENRKECIKRLALLVKFQDFYDETSLKIRKLQDRMDKLEQKVDRTAEEYREVEKERAYYEKKLSQVIAGKETVTDDLMQFVNKSDRYHRALNNYHKYAMLKGVLEKNNSIVEDSINNISLMAFGTPQILGSSTIEGLKQTINDFEDSIIAQKKEIKNLNNLNDHVDSVLEEAVSDLIGNRNFTYDGNLEKAIELKRQRMEEIHETV